MVTPMTMRGTLVSKLKRGGNIYSGLLHAAPFWGQSCLCHHLIGKYDEVGQLSPCRRGGSRVVGLFKHDGSPAAA